LLYLNLQANTRPSRDIVVSTKAGTFTLSQQAAKRIAFEGPAMRASHAITVLNMPGMIVEILISMRNSPSIWHPANLCFEVWRSITLPFFCLPAWWFVGRGFDSLWHRQKLRWVTTSIGTLLFVSFVVLFCGLRFAVPAADRVGASWPLWGMALWALLFGVFPIAWLVCRRSPRHD